MWEFRSDTFTRPDEGMRRAMATAEVGDDVWGEDPTVRELEETAAAICGKEAAVFISSGTMGNAIGVRLHAGQGDELYAHARSHVVDNEGGGSAALWGIAQRQLHGADGMFDEADLEAWVADGSDPHHPIPRIVCIENTSMAAMGGPWPMERLARVSAYAHERGMKVHIDGARMFNAAVALGVGPHEICAHADSVTFCLSKGLGAPVGSVLCCSGEDIGKAHRLRKLLGGGMRQAGIVAAAGLYALERNVERLADDHANARRLAEGLAETGRLAVDPARVRTNMVLACVTRESDTAAAVCRDLDAVGVRAAPYDGRTVRFATSLEVDGAGVEAALEAANRVLR
jgi:threonine aldolase